MQWIPTRVHGVLDYLVGLLLVASPWLLGFARGGAETWLPVILGVGAVVYSLLTDYEWGVVPLLPMPAHLLLDAGSGLLLATSPWLLDFAAAVWLPHMLFGLFEVAAAGLTQTRPGQRRHLGGVWPAR